VGDSQETANRSICRSEVAKIAFSDEPGFSEFREIFKVCSRWGGRVRDRGFDGSLIGISGGDIKGKSATPLRGGAFEVTTHAPWN